MYDSCKNDVTLECDCKFVTYLAEQVGFLEQNGFQLSIANIAMDSVAYAQELVGIEDDKLGVGDEDFRRLTVFNGHDEGIDSVAQVIGIGFCL